MSNTFSDVRAVTTRIRNEAAQARLLVSNVRMAARAIQALAKGPIGFKKGVKLAAAASAALGLNSQYVQLIQIIQDKQHLQEALHQAVADLKLDAQNVARRAIYNALGKEINAINDLLGTYQEVRDTIRELYPEITELIKLVKLL